MPDNSVYLSIDTATHCCHLTRCRQIAPVQGVNQLKTGEWLEMIATDPGSVKDVQAWSQQTGHALVESRQDREKYKFIVEKAA